MTLKQQQVLDDLESVAIYATEVVGRGNPELYMNLMEQYLKMAKAGREGYRHDS